jgi:hypothetical protein
MYMLRAGLKQDINLQAYQTFQGTTISAIYTAFDAGYRMDQLRANCLFLVH